MRKHLVVVGGGFSGVWASIGAAKHREIVGKACKLDITLINKSPHHAIRPRFYECKKDVILPLKEILRPVGVRLLEAEVSHINPVSKKIFMKKWPKPLSFTRCVLAAGSVCHMPNIPGINKYGFNVDSFNESQRLYHHLRQTYSNNDLRSDERIIVIGGGLTGIEVATHLNSLLEDIVGINKSLPRVMLVDHGAVGMHLKPAVRKVVLDALYSQNIQIREGDELSSIDENHVKFSSGECVPSKTVICSVGVQASSLTRCFKLPLDPNGRLTTERSLQLEEFPSFFVAGDVARVPVDDTYYSLMTCQHARPQGVVAGYNAVASLCNMPLLRYAQPKYVTCIDLGKSGAVYTEGWEQELICSGEQAKAIKREINCSRIYPPEPYTKEVLFNAAKLHAVPCHGRTHLTKIT